MAGSAQTLHIICFSLSSIEALSKKSLPPQIAGSKIQIHCPFRLILSQDLYVRKSVLTELWQYLYRPQRSCEGYVFTGVCLSTGGVSASVHGGMHPWELTPPPPPGADLPEQTSPLEQTPPRSRQPPEQTPPAPPGSRHPPKETATAADSTHPTGMHSCCKMNLNLHIFLTATVSDSAEFAVTEVLPTAIHLYLPLQ